MKTLRIWNGGDWGHRGGKLYVAAYSVAECVRLANEAFRKVKGCGDEVTDSFTPNYVRNYWSADCWGNSMDGVTPERGVWHQPQCTTPPKRII